MEGWWGDRPPFGCPVYILTNSAPRQLPEGTRFTHAEHGVFLDEFWADGVGREEGTRGILEALGRHLC